LVLPAVAYRSLLALDSQQDALLQRKLPDVAVRGVEFRP
jgi:hypothetical protein